MRFVYRSIILIIMILIGNSIKAQIVINEVMPYPNTNGSCPYDQSLLIRNSFTSPWPSSCGSNTASNGNESIELFNPTCSAIDISHRLFLPLIKN